MNGTLLTLIIFVLCSCSYCKDEYVGEGLFVDTRNRILNDDHFCNFDYEDFTIFLKHAKYTEDKMNQEVIALYKATENIDELEKAFTPENVANQENLIKLKIYFKDLYLLSTNMLKQCSDYIKNFEIAIENENFKNSKSKECILKNFKFVKEKWLCMLMQIKEFQEKIFDEYDNLFAFLIEKKNKFHVMEGLLIFFDMNDNKTYFNHIDNIDKLTKSYYAFMKRYNSNEREKINT